MEMYMKEEMQQDLQDLVAIVKEEPQGVPLKALSAFFQRNFRRKLNPHALGFNSLANLVDNMDDLVTVGRLSRNKVVFHRENYAAVCTETETRDEVIENIVNMVKNRPNGYGVKTLPTTYWQKFRKELSVRALGFETMEALVNSLGDLVLAEKRVFHVTHFGQAQGGDPQRSLSTAAHTSSSASSSAAAPETLTQDQLFQRVMEVMKKYRLDNPPMSRLQSCYLEHFGSELPFDQYMSLYDSWEASQGQLKATSVPHTDGTTPGEPTVLLSGQKDLEDLVQMVWRYPEGVPVGSLWMLFQKTFHRCLSLKALGFDSVENLVASLDGELFIRGWNVFHKSMAVNEVSIHQRYLSEEKERSEILANLMNMLKGRPKGIRLTSLGKLYTDKYDKRINLKRFGVNTNRELVVSLREYMFIIGKRVRHVMYKKKTESSKSPESSDSEDVAPSTQPQGGLLTVTHSLLGSPLFITTPTPGTATPPRAMPGSAQEPTDPQRSLSTAAHSSSSASSSAAAPETLTQDQQLQRVMEESWETGKTT